MFYQLTNLLIENFEDNKGLDKHSDKANNTNENHDVVYASADWNNLMDTAYDFSNFIKAEFTDVKKIQGIQPNHITDFLKTKVDTCTQKTIGGYLDRLCKINRMIDTKFKTCVRTDWRSQVEVPVSKVGESIRTIAMTPEDRDKIVDFITKKDEICA